MYATYLPVMCWSQYPPNFFGKKNGKDQNSVSCTKKKAYLWFPQGMIIFPGGVRQKWNFQRGGGGLFCELILENSEGMGVIGKIPSVGGLWIFSGTTLFFLNFFYLNNIYCNICSRAKRAQLESLCCL